MPGGQCGPVAAWNWWPAAVLSRKFPRDGAHPMQPASAVTTQEERRAMTSTGLDILLGGDLVTRHPLSRRAAFPSLLAGASGRGLTAGRPHGACLQLLAPFRMASWGTKTAADLGIYLHGPPAASPSKHDRRPGLTPLGTPANAGPGASKQQSSVSVRAHRLMAWSDEPDDSAGRGSREGGSTTPL